MNTPATPSPYSLALAGLCEASRALTALDPMGERHNAAAIDDALQAMGRAADRETMAARALTLAEDLAGWPLSSDPLAPGETEASEGTDDRDDLPRLVRDVVESARQIVSHDRRAEIYDSPAMPAAVPAASIPPHRAPLCMVDLLGRALEYVEKLDPRPLMDATLAADDLAAAESEAVDNRNELAHSIRNALHIATLAQGEALSGQEAGDVGAVCLSALREGRDYLRALLDMTPEAAGDALTNNGEDVEARLSEALARAEVAHVAPSPLDDNALQFPRLIAEAYAAGAFDPETVDAMAASMDLEPAEVHALIVRAENAFEDMKAALPGSPILSPRAQTPTVASLCADLLTLCDGEDDLCERLDELTHDAQIADASEVNNQGAHAQLAALLAAGVCAETIRKAVDDANPHR